MIAQHIGLSWVSVEESPNHVIYELKIRKNIAMEWVFLVAQTVKNLPAKQETGVQSLGQEDPLEKGMSTCSSIHSEVLKGQDGWSTLHLESERRMSGQRSWRHDRGSQYGNEASGL